MLRTPAKPGLSIAYFTRTGHTANMHCRCANTAIFVAGKGLERIVKVEKRCVEFHGGAERKHAVKVWVDLRAHNATLGGSNLQTLGDRDVHDQPISDLKLR